MLKMAKQFEVYLFYRSFGILYKIKTTEVLYLHKINLISCLEELKSVSFSTVYDFKNIPE